MLRASNMKTFKQIREELDDETLDVYTFTEEQWNALSEEEQDDFEDFEVDGEYDAENGSAIWVVGDEEFDVLGVMEEGKSYSGRSRRQVHMTQIKKRRMKGRNRAKKLRTNIKRRKAHNRIKIKRNRLKITRRFGGGDKSGRSGKIGNQRKRRGGRTITHKG
ncbi:MAG TPA: hypothetical protein EYP92_00370 [Candidatus Thioglobus sp.]|nr:hypothetical protein [Candidatus Thioglobus sp.]